MDLRIVVDDLSGREIRELLAEHLREMHALTPAESVHALDLSGLQRPEVTCWTAWSEGKLLGCGALREIDPTHGEIKSMRTAPAYRGRGVAQQLLDHILEEARVRAYRRLSLETGSTAAFSSARRLYARSGFVTCGPFGEYREDPNSVFMTLVLGERPEGAA